jgi:hypothetical protein
MLKKAIILPAAMLLLGLIATCGITPTSETIAEVTASKTFSYQVHVQSKETGENIPKAEITIEVAGIAPLDVLTDSRGGARVFIDARYAGKPGRLTIEAKGYQGYNQNIDLNPESLPDVIQLEPLLKTPTPTNTPTSEPTSTPSPLDTPTSEVDPTSEPTNTPEPPTDTPVPPPTNTSTPEPNILFADDFEEGEAYKWRFDLEDWKVRLDESGNHSFCVNKTTEGYTHARIGSLSPEWDNYLLVFDMMINSWTSDKTSSGSIQMRYIEDVATYEYAFNDGGGDITKLIFSPELHGEPLEGNSYQPHKLGEWQPIRIEANGAEIKVLVDNKEILQTFDSNPINQGGIRFGVGIEEGASGEYDICFDNVQVIRLEPEE